MVEGPADFFSGRLSRKERQQSFGAELLNDASLKNYRQAGLSLQAVLSGLRRVREWQRRLAYEELIIVFKISAELREPNRLPCTTKTARMYLTNSVCHFWCARKRKYTELQTQADRTSQKHYTKHKSRHKPNWARK